MSAILTLLGRVTKDPEMQQGKNSGTEYILLDIATSQRGPDGKDESIFYQCYFNKFLAERLQKAGVKKATGLMVYGDLELHPFIYQQGKHAGEPSSGPRINVKDWNFLPYTRSDNNAGSSGTNPNGVPQNGGGAATPAAGGYPAQGNPNGGYQTQGMPNGSYQQSAPMAPANGQYPSAPTGNGQPQNNYPPQGSYQGMPNYGSMPAGQPNDGFSNVPEQMANQLPFY